MAQGTDTSSNGTNSQGGLRDPLQRDGNVFMMVEPLAGWHQVAVTDRRTAVDFARLMKWLVVDGYPDANVVRGVLDNLNTYEIALLYASFTPPQARRLARKLESRTRDISSATPSHPGVITMISH
jgi:hypothetical protein